MSYQPKQLPAIRRFITTHDAQGNAIWDDTVPVQVQENRSGGFSTHVSYVNEDSSNTLTGDYDLKAYRENPSEKDLAPASGSSLRVVDFWPGFPAVMHRTASVDYGIVMEGEIECVLDNGSTKTFRRGDIIIQRGTNHAWKNTGAEIARICFTLLPSPPVKIHGRELEVHGFADLPRLAEESTI
jgi:quercetin dioxygenase-like cupin family protein